MRLITWNLNHRAKPRIIKAEVSSVVASPDIVVFTEYVPGSQHQGFLASLAATGLRYSFLPPFAPKENHVLVVSRLELTEGVIRGPAAIGPSVPSNVLRVRILKDGFDILGLRVPDYSREPHRRRECWNWIQKVAHSVVEKPFILIGDFNADPRYPRAKCGDRIAAMVRSGWQHAAPGIGGSYWTPSGHEVAIDHAFVSRHFQVRTSKYIKGVNGTILVGGSGALSDHAALMVELHRLL